MSLINRKGIIKVSNELINSEMGISMLLSLMSEFAPVIIENTLTHKVYHGFSGRFKEVKEGEQIPIYDAKIQKSEELMGYYDWVVNFEIIG